MTRKIDDRWVNVILTYQLDVFAPGILIEMDPTIVLQHKSNLKIFLCKSLLVKKNPVFHVFRMVGGGVPLRTEMIDETPPLFATLLIWEDTGCSYWMTTG